MKTLITIARKGRAMGVSLIVGTQLPSAKVISPQVRANLATAIAFQCRTHIESQAIIGKAGAEGLDRPGLALAFLDGRWQTVQTLRVGDDGGDLADTVAVPVAPVLAPVEVDLVTFALDDLGGCFIINRLYDQFKGQVSKRQLTKLAQKWAMRGWLTEPMHRADPRRVTDELAALAGGGLPCGQGTVSDDTVTRMARGGTASEPVTGPGDTASEPMTGAMRAGVGFPIPTFS